MEAFDGAHLGVGERLRERAPGIGEEAQGAAFGDTGVKLAERSGGGVPGVGEGLGPGIGLAGVERVEIGVAHVDLAADFHEVRCTRQRFGDVIHGKRVLGHVFAHGPVAPGGGLNEAAVFVAKGQAEPVDLRFGGVGNGGVEAEVAADGGIEIGHVLVGEGVAEGQHPHGVGDLGKAVRRGRAHLFAGAVGAFQGGEEGLDRAVPGLQRIIVGVRNLWRIRRVVGEIGPAKRIGEPFEFGARFVFGQVFGRFVGKHRPLPLPTEGSVRSGKGRGPATRGRKVDQAPTATRVSSIPGSGSRRT